MVRVALLLYSLIGTTLAGSLMVVALASGFDTLWPVVGSAALGFVLAVPVSVLVAKRIVG